MLQNLLGESSQTEDDRQSCAKIRNAEHDVAFLVTSLVVKKAENSTSKCESRNFEQNQGSNDSIDRHILRCRTAHRRSLLMLETGIADMKNVVQLGIALHWNYEQGGTAVRLFGGACG